MAKAQDDMIAELQRANAELRRERDAALAREAALSEVLDIINSSPGDPGPVFEAILDKAHQLCSAAVGSLMTYDGTYVRARAARGFPEEHEALIRQPFRLHPFGGLSARQSIHGEQPKTFEAGLERLIHGERVLQIADFKTLETQPDSEVNRSTIERTNVRSCLTVPLRKDGAFVGYISAFRLEVRPFSEAEIALLESFAAQAVVAMENARLITEQREALEQQTATAEVLQVINASPGDLTPVFDAMLEKAMRLCGAAFGILETYDGEEWHAVADRGVPPSYAEFRRSRTHVYGPGTTPARLLAGERPVHVLDITSEDAHRDGEPNRLALADLGGARTVVAVPLLRDDAVLGFIMIYRQEVRPFTDKQIALLQNFAAQAVIAGENARLLNEQREALEQQTATAEVLQVINANPGNLTPVFDAMLEKAMRLCDTAYGIFATYDGDAFLNVAWRGVPPALAQREEFLGAPIRPRLGALLYPLMHGEDVVHVADIKDDEFYRSGNRQRRALVDVGGARTVLEVALRKDNTLLGAINVFRQEVHPFTDKQIALLQTFAAQAVIAMENARLITEQQDALEQQTATAEVLQVINASPGDLTPVFDAILDKAHTLCGATVGSLVTYDGEFFRAVATHGFPEQHAETVRLPVRASARHHALLRGERFVQTPDLRAIELSAEDIIMRGLIEYTDARTRLMVPLRKDGALLGFITAYRSEVRLFSDNEIALLENFAAQAVIAMENARLINEQREALEQQTATAEVLQVINASPGNLTPVFDAILEKARILCEATYGGLMLRDEEGFRIVAARGAAPFVEAWRQLGPIRPPPGAWSERLIRGDTTIVHVIDVRADDIYSTLPTEIRQLYELGGIRTYLVAPLRKDDTILGLIILFRQEVRPFTDKQIALLQNFAAQAVIAIENARLLDEIRQRQAELRTTFDNMGDGVAMFDTDLRLAAWNRNFQRIIDLPDTLLETRPGYADYLRLLAERGEFGTTDIEAELSLRIEDTDKELRLERVRPDGRVIEVRRNAVSGGGFVLIYSDITERKRSEEEIRAARDAAEAALRELRTAQANLIQAEKMASLGQLTAGIAHEIKNPLNFVNNFAALSVDLLSELKETAAPGFAALTEKQRAEVEEVSVMLTSNLEKITEHGKRADGIVKAMLEHSRGSSGERRMVDLNTLIEEALNLAYHGARAQDQSFNITLERDFGEGIAPIEVNPQDITRVFLNIFGNGFYATTRRARDGGDAEFVPTLKVTTRNAEEAVEIRVRDSGTGIPADIRDKLFQPFFTTKPTGEGTGLGLSITYDIVTQQHGGNIAVDSKVGEYSEFTIRLPRKP